MPFKDLDLKTRIVDATNIFIRNSDFETLKNTCVDVKPVPEVVTYIENILKIEFEQEADENEKKLKQEFVEKQVKEDEQEERDDNLKRESDSNLKNINIINLKTYNEQISYLTSSLDNISLKLTSCREEKRKRGNELTYTKEKLNNLLEKQKLIKQQIQQSQETHLHEHPNNSGPENIPIHSHSSVDLPSRQPIDSLKIKLLEIEKEILDQKRGVNYLENECKALTTTVREIEVSKNEKTTELNKLKQRVEEITEELINKIPARENQRLANAFSRDKRKSVSSEEIPNRLSQANYAQLSRKIDQVKSKLKKEYECNMAKTKEDSYKLFLDNLPSTANENLALSSSDKQNLSNIKERMIKYIAIQEEITKEKNKLEVLNNNAVYKKNSLKAIEENSKNLEKQSKDCRISIQKLTSKNDKISKEIPKLKKKLKNGFKISLAILFVSLLVAGPALFVPYFNNWIFQSPNVLLTFFGLGITAAGTFIGITFEAVKTFYQKRRAEKEIKNNDIQINYNHEHIKENINNHNINEQNISELQQNINELNTNIDTLNEQVISLVQKAADHLSQTLLNLPESVNLDFKEDIKYAPTFFASNDSNPHLNSYNESNNRDGDSFKPAI